ncbi:MAG: hypothetical protein ACOVOR_01285 [Rhabdochlamydiaceae bacterium]
MSMINKNHSSQYTEFGKLYTKIAEDVNNLHAEVSQNKSKAEQNVNTLKKITESNEKESKKQELKDPSKAFEQNIAINAAKLKAIREEIFQLQLIRNQSFSDEIQKEIELIIPLINCVVPNKQTVFLQQFEVIKQSALKTNALLNELKINLDWIDFLVKESSYLSNQYNILTGNKDLDWIKTIYDTITYSLFLTPSPPPVSDPIITTSDTPHLPSSHQAPTPTDGYIYLGPSPVVDPLSHSFVKKEEEESYPVLSTLELTNTSQQHSTETTFTTPTVLPTNYHLNVVKTGVAISRSSSGDNFTQMINEDNQNFDHLSGSLNELSTINLTDDLEERKEPHILHPKHRSAQIIPTDDPSVYNHIGQWNDERNVQKTANIDIEEKTDHCSVRTILSMESVDSELPNKMDSRDNQWCLITIKSLKFTHICVYQKWEEVTKKDFLSSINEETSPIKEEIDTFKRRVWFPAQPINDTQIAKNIVKDVNTISLKMQVFFTKYRQYTELQQRTYHLINFVSEETKEDLDKNLCTLKDTIRDLDKQFKEIQGYKKEAISYLEKNTSRSLLSRIANFVNPLAYFAQ